MKKAHLPSYAGSEWAGETYTEYSSVGIWLFSQRACQSILWRLALFKLGAIYIAPM
jgi:hypothetical protein